MCSKEGDSEGKAHGTHMNDVVGGFGLPKCIVRSRERRRVHETLLKFE